MATRPLRIVHFLTQACGPDSSDGVLKSVFQLSAAQRALGHEVVLADQLFGAGQQSRGVRLARKLRRLWCTLPQAVAAQLLQLGPDIVHLHSVHVPENVAVARALRGAGIPYCVTTHGGLAHVARRRRRLRKMAFAWLWERRYFDAAAFVHALTAAEEGDIRSFGVSAPILVVPNGIDLSALPSAADAQALERAVPGLRGRRVFMYAGRLEPVQKGLDTLIEAFAAARAPNTALLLVGPDSKGGVTRLASLIAQFGADATVAMLGPASGQRLADLMAGADVFVHPSRWEGVSLSVLEAAARGKPCLLTRAADPGGALQSASAAIVVDGSVSDMANAISRLAAMDRAQLEALGARARSTVLTQFALRNTAASIVDAYRNVSDCTGVEPPRQHDSNVSRAYAAYPGGA